MLRLQQAGLQSTVEGSHVIAPEQGLCSPDLDRPADVTPAEATNAAPPTISCGPAGFSLGALHCTSRSRVSHKPGLQVPQHAHHLLGCSQLTLELSLGCLKVFLLLLQSLQRCAVLLVGAGQLSLQVSQAESHFPYMHIQCVIKQTGRHQTSNLGGAAHGFRASKV